MSTDLPINLEKPFPNPNEVKPLEKISPAENFPERNAADTETKKKKEEEKKKINPAPDSDGVLGKNIDLKA